MSSDKKNVPGTSRSEIRMVTAELNDGQLQIVDMAPYDKGTEVQTIEGHIVEDSESGGEDMKYVQVLNSGKEVMDLLNLTLVRSADGQESYRLVTTESECGGEDTVTCVLSNEDGDDQDNQEESYVMVESDDGPLVFLQSSLQHANPAMLKTVDKKIPTITPVEILEKAKALQKAKALLSVPPRRKPGRRRKGELPPPHELLSSPHFKLFLYSCKLCSFRCNAIKELTVHKATEHSGGNKVKPGSGRAAAITLQCARCPFRGHSHTQLMKHVKENHIENESKVFLDSDEVEAADVLVCGACGFESDSRTQFRKHIEDAHGATAC